MAVPLRGVAYDSYFRKAEFLEVNGTIMKLI
jgi:hypothetical protein